MFTTSANFSIPIEISSRIGRIFDSFELVIIFFRDLLSLSFAFQWWTIGLFLLECFPLNQAIPFYIILFIFAFSNLLQNNSSAIS